MRAICCYVNVNLEGFAEDSERTEIKEERNTFQEAILANVFPRSESFQPLSMIEHDHNMNKLKKRESSGFRSSHSFLL